MGTAEWVPIVAIKHAPPEGAGSRSHHSAPTARTLRRRLLSVPGRITRTARTTTLRMPARWPWELEFLTALKQLRALPALS